jgi:RNA polymerase sigma-70 factor (ECF subfamily)
MMPDEFVPMVLPHLTVMLRVARAMVGSAEAEDVAQEAITRAWQSFATLREAEAARAWLLRITVNLCYNWRRHVASQGGVIPLLDELEHVRPSAVDLGLAQYAAVLDVREAIRRLDSDHQQLVALRYYVGLDATEIGAALGVPPATVRTRLRRALALMRDYIAYTDPHLTAQARHQKGSSHV